MANHFIDYVYCHPGYYGLSKFDLTWLRRKMKPGDSYGSIPEHKQEIIISKRNSTNFPLVPGEEIRC